ncbi:MAG: molybdopterin-guanine dinucleotide biosynthesis protein B [Euryarchaeota archaeon]|nr:molybdopterin-guanine dinucleotide biosynthesis protein B [Euryarchaeota archaeon]MBU4547562.1 molybdopterin-guanine dinucleotide biosynthesis protein B [Euryarchaeota archaeon]MBU4607600.1 molybdopterin-guanine dinucleotide biosynthesis protein B [Euryarchaeota archaeon]MBV1755173.1 molybdopterin-guanine dinucleotide biosynthesis protein B [Methanobacterium sp.]
MKIISVIGTKDTGKTTLVTRLVEKLSQKGYSVGTMKFSHVHFDLADKDTGKHRQAGAKIVVGTGKETFILFDNPLDVESIITTIESYDELDFLVMEGFKSSKFAKISVSSLKDDYTIQQVDVKSLNDEKMDELVEIIEKRSYGLLQDLNCKKCGFESCADFSMDKVQGVAPEVHCKSQFKGALLEVNGKRIPLNPFVQNIIAKTVTGMINSLDKDSEDIDTIKILVRDRD